MITESLKKITLTDERPVMVSNRDWPCLVTVDDDLDGYLDGFLRVRIHDTGKGNGHHPHPDGMCLVYGWRLYPYRAAGYRCRLDSAPFHLAKVAKAIDVSLSLLEQAIAALPAKKL